MMKHYLYIIQDVFSFFKGDFFDKTPRLLPANLPRVEKLWYIIFDKIQISPLLLRLYR